MIKIIVSIFALIFSSLLLAGIAVAAVIMTLPDVQQLETCFTTSMYQVKLCAESDNYAKLTDISPYVLHAVIAAEDGTFYSHDGFDWHEMEESFNADMHSGKIRRGGSTLTQQLAKNAFLTKDKSIWRKLKEAYLAHGIEKHYTKDFILEKYLNVVEFGKDLYGVKPAAEKYFHKPPSQLNPLEAAFLAFLLPNPKVYSKSFSAGKLTPFAHRMIAVILKRMNSYGKLSPGGYEVAMANLPNFPWSGLSNAAFHEMPTYSLDANVPEPKITDDQAIGEAGSEDDNSEPSTKNVTTQKAPSTEEKPIVQPEPSTVGTTNTDSETPAVNSDTSSDSNDSKDSPSN